ncbi:hypothetical protein [Spiroplasma poulsonii]|uniref:hypothetical protein n=1 Tax=Spiroplasma poulsonii TaxID=2138 RepID=UPI001F4D2D33|nr:hypothetical protein [Spiroplasma poulsonii]UNF61342.1 hypothetical protein MNU24_05350 [Spiroplasma poulsonii]
MIILMINYYYLMLPKLQPKMPKRCILILVKRKHTIKTQVIIEQETKNTKCKFFARKNMIMLLFKESKIPNLKNNKLIVDSGYQGIQKKSQ